MALHPDHGHLHPDRLLIPAGRTAAIIPTLTLRAELSKVIRQVRPDVVLCQSPKRRWDRVFASHPDRLAADAGLGEDRLAEAFLTGRTG